MLTDLVLAGLIYAIEKGSRKIGVEGLRETSHEKGGPGRYPPRVARSSSEARVADGKGGRPWISRGRADRRRMYGPEAVRLRRD